MKKFWQILGAVSVLLGLILGAKEKFGSNTSVPSSTSTDAPQ